MIFPVFPRHLDFVEVREHADLIESLVMAPYDQRNLVLHGDLDGQHGLPGKNVPIHAAQVFQSRLRYPPDKILAQRHRVTVRVEDRFQIRKVPVPALCIVVLVVAHQQRVHAELAHQGVHDEIGIPRARHGHDAVEELFACRSVRFEKRLQDRAAFIPIQAVLFLVNAAAAANAFIVQNKAERMGNGGKGIGRTAWPRHVLMKFRPMERIVFQIGDVDWYGVVRSPAIRSKSISAVVAFGSFGFLEDNRDDVRHQILGSDIRTDFLNALLRGAEIGKGLRRVPARLHAVAIGVVLRGYAAVDTDRSQAGLHAIGYVIRNRRMRLVEVVVSKPPRLVLFLGIVLADVAVVVLT